MTGFSNEKKAKKNKAHHLTFENALKSHAKGDYIEAERQYKFLIDHGYYHPSIFLNYGVISKKNGNIKRALELYEKAINLYPNKPEIYSNLGLLYGDLNKKQKAEAYIRKAIKIKPDYTDGLFNLGIVLQDQGKIEEAIIFYKKVIKYKPKSFAAYLNIGAILKDMGDFEQAEVYTRNALKIQSNSNLAYINLALILHHKGKLNDATVCIKQAIKLNPENHIAYNIFGLILADLNQNEAAKKETLKCIKLKSDFAEGYANLAKIQKDSGDIDEAILSARAAIKNNSKLTSPYFILSTYKPVKNLADYKDFLFSESILSNQKKINLIDIYFARANYLSRQYCYDKEWQMLELANNLNRSIYKSNYNTFLKKMNNYMKLWDKLAIQKQNEKNLPNSIFTVGLPRSGKTIVESILLCNPTLGSVGESGDLSISIDEYMGTKTHTQYSLNEIYINRINSNIHNKSFICNTNPNNFIYSGIIASQIKNSKIIFCFRNPLDNIVEIYKMNLKQKFSFKSSINEIVSIYFAIYNLMEEYKKIFKDSIYFLNYESLILNTEEEIKKLLFWLKWEFNKNYLKPKLHHSTNLEENNNEFILNIEYINRWRNYSNFLVPAIKAIKENDKYEKLPIIYD